MFKEQVLNIIKKMAKTATGDLGFYFKDLNSGECIGYNEDRVYQAASVFKIFVLAELVRQVDEGKYSLEDRFPLKEEDKSDGSGVLGLLDGGCDLTIKDYATLMMIISDNTAADFLFNLIGRENIYKNVLKPLNLTNTKCDLQCRDLIAQCYQLPEGTTVDELIANEKPYLRDTDAFTGRLELNDDTSPKDVACVLEHFYYGKWVSAHASETVLEIMKECQTNARIPRFLPPGTVVAHKTGTMDRVVNDAGIIYTQKGDYILSMFYNGNRASEEEYKKNEHGYFGERILADISRGIYNLYTE